MHRFVQRRTACRWSHRFRGITWVVLPARFIMTLRPADNVGKRMLATIAAASAIDSLPVQRIALPLSRPVSATECFPVDDGTTSPVLGFSPSPRRTRGADALARGTPPTPRGAAARGWDPL